MFSYRQMFSQSFKIAWKNKYLWFFGLFASLLSIGSEYQILTRAMSRNASLEWLYSWNNFFHSGLFSRNFFSNIITLFNQSPFSMSIALVIFLLVLGAVLLLVWLAVISQVALVDNSNRIIKSKKEVADLGLHTGILAGNKNFWSVLGLNIISKIVVGVLVFLVSLPLIFMFWNKAFSAIVYIVLFVLLIPLSVGFSLMIKYAISFVVLKKAKFIPALKSAWNLFAKNWIVSLELAFLLFSISFFSTLAILTVSLLVAILFFFLALAFLSMFTNLAFWSVIILGVLIITLFIIFCGSILSAFQIVSWTNLFNHLNLGIESKLERLAPEGLKAKKINFK